MQSPTNATSAAGPMPPSYGQITTTAIIPAIVAAPSATYAFMDRS